jgi:RNA 2',3'-cyclic 3'-phosphodiesterase
VRAFVAFYPDELARSELVEVAPEDAADVRVTDMADWHVTLRFLGEVPDDRVDDLAAVAAAAAAAVAPFTARLGPLTALGTGARVLFVPVHGAEPLVSVLDAVLDDLVEPRDGPYRGHLTLARARGRGRLPSTLSGLPVAVSFPVDAAALVASSLEPDRAVHRVVATFALGDG